MNFNTGKRLKELRLLLCLSQSKLSEDASIDEKYYGRLERNESIPTVTTLEKICKVLGISLIQFFMPASKILRQDPLSEYYIQKAQVDIMEYEIDLHFNRDVILKGCNNCIWYSGYIETVAKLLVFLEPSDYVCIIPIRFNSPKIYCLNFFIRNLD